MNEIIIASHNPGKVKEFRSLFQDLAIEVKSLADYPELTEVEETGTSFEENASLKAETIAKALNTMVIADDSGLCVHALDNAPGVYSARYAGQPSDARKNNLKLLENMQGVEDRSAHFVCVLAVAHPQKEILLIRGQAEGQILDHLTGDQGFGYDPLFYVESEGATFAQISKQRKNEISHRAQAFNQLMKVLPQWLEETVE
ncbi:TPA: XTP/dITP diphosphatase [Streptococcus suis]